MEFPTPEQPGIRFERRYGTRHAELPDGRQVTTLSQPAWEDFAMSFIDLEADGGPGAYILTPELITSADITPDSTASFMPVVEERIRQAKELTRLYPESTLLLGTAVTDPQFPRPRNALLFLQNGDETGRTYKTSTLNYAEHMAFHQPGVPELAQPEPGIMPVICADFINHPRVLAGTHTLLVSACWGAPTGRPGVLAAPDNRHVEILTLTAGDLFASHPGLQRIVMADRLPSGAVASAPFNFVASRTKQGGGIFN